jgi:hypothetical protein
MAGSARCIWQRTLALNRLSRTVDHSRVPQLGGLFKSARRTCLSWLGSAHNEDVLSLQARDLREGLLETLTDLFLVLIAISTSISLIGRRDVVDGNAHMVAKSWANRRVRRTLEVLRTQGNLRGDGSQP